MKDYQKPEMEIITLTAVEATTNDSDFPGDVGDVVSNTLFPQP